MAKVVKTGRNKKKEFKVSRLSFYFGLLLALLVIVPALMVSFYRQTNFDVHAAPLPPKIEQTITGGSTNSSRVTTSSSVQNGSGNLYLASVSTKPYVAVSRISGLGLSWSKVKAQCGARQSTGVEVWMAFGSPSSSGTVTATLSKTPENSVIAVSRFSQIDSQDPISDAVGRNTRGTNGACSGGSDTDKYSLPMSMDRNSIAYSATGIRLRSHTAASGLQEVVEFHRGSDAGDRAGIAVVSKYLPDSRGITLSGNLNSETDWASVGVQIHGISDSSLPLPTTTRAPTISPTRIPGTTITLAPTQRPTTSPTSRPTSTPSTPQPTSPPSAPVKGIWTSASELASKPMSGDAWNAVKSAADSLSSSANPDLDNQDDGVNVQVLAAAIAYSRTGDTTYRSKVVSALQKVEGFVPNGRSLAWARETGAYAMAADLVGYRTTAFEKKMRDMAETYKCSQMGVSLLAMYKERPNNWGSQAFGSLTAIYSYLGDTNKLREVRDHYVRGVTGPKPSETEYGSLSWQCNESDPRIINPKGCTKNCGGTVNVDGIIPDDMRRGGNCSSNPGFTGYPWEGMQGYVMGARVLERAGMPIWDVGDKALCRAASALQDGRFGDSWKATGDDQWQLVFLDKACGKNWSANYGTGKWQSGKNTGWGYVAY